MAWDAALRENRMVDGMGIHAMGIMSAREKELLKLKASPGYKARPKPLTYSTDWWRQWKSKTKMQADRESKTWSTKRKGARSEQTAARLHEVVDVKNKRASGFSTQNTREASRDRPRAPLFSLSAARDGRRPHEVHTEVPYHTGIPQVTVDRLQEHHLRTSLDDSLASESCSGRSVKVEAVVPVIASSTSVGEGGQNHGAEDQLLVTKNPALLPDQAPEAQGFTSDPDELTEQIEGRDQTRFAALGTECPVLSKDDSWMASEPTKTPGRSEQRGRLLVEPASDAGDQHSQQTGLTSLVSVHSRYEASFPEYSFPTASRFPIAKATTPAPSRYHPVVGNTRGQSPSAIFG